MQVSGHNVKLSVLMVTYNHEKFISQALESILTQRVGFDYEIVIGEDCSTDSTRAIVMDYRQKYPDIIKLLLPDNNRGMMCNFMKTFEACSGTYIAMLEGDDFWTDPFKLQKQVDYLDSHPESVACFHNAQIEYENEPGKQNFFHATQMKDSYTLLDILNESIIPTCSTVFRAGLFGMFPDWYSSMPMGDWPLHVMNAQHGDYGYLAEVMATYRVHDGGVWSSQKRIDILSKTIFARDVIRNYLGCSYKTIVNIKTAGLYDEKVSIEYGDLNVVKLAVAAFYSLYNYPDYTRFVSHRRTFLNCVRRKVGLRTFLRAKLRAVKMIR